MNALNPVLTVGAQMRDACEAHSNMTKAEIEARSKEVLRLVWHRSRCTCTATRTSSPAGCGSAR